MTNSISNPLDDLAALGYTEYIPLGDEATQRAALAAAFAEGADLSAGRYDVVYTPEHLIAMAAPAAAGEQVAGT